MNVVNAYFEKKLQEIREDDMQLAAYKAVNNTVVIAGPGSGKTTVLTLKVMQLLAEVIYSAWYPAAQHCRRHQEFYSYSRCNTA